MSRTDPGSRALAGLAVVAAFSRRAFGAATALTATALLCFDPSFLLLACHDWGSFSLSFLLRGVTLWCGWRWWDSRRTAWLWTAAFTTGLAFYNKVDIVIFASAVGIALLVVAAKPLSRAWREEPRAARTAAGACVAFAIGLAPMFPALPAVFAARNAFAEPNELAEKLHTLWTMLDGSYFHRLMATGGIFGADSLGQVADAQASALPIALLLGVAWLLYRIATAPAGQRDPRALFLLLSSALSILGVMALPGAVRIHHAMNVYPLLHWLVAYALVDAARTLSGEATSGRRPGRMIALGALWTLALAVVASQWRTFDHTVSRYQQSGGKGRWSNAIHAFAATLDEDFEGTVSSLDWGFHEPLALLSRGGTFRESHWQIPRALRERPAWVIVGEPGDYYILHLAPYDRSGFGRLFVSAVAEANDDRITALEHLDGDGDVAFVTVRVEAPHRVSFAGTATGEGAFKIELGP